MDEVPFEHLSDDAIERSVGTQAFHRGRGYARAGQVTGLRMVDDRILVASVWGSRSDPYQTIVPLDTDRNGRPHIAGGSCTCPVGYDCKHVAAVLVAARDGVGPVPRVIPATAVWEERLEDLVGGGTARQDEDQTPLALQFELASAKAPSFSYRRTSRPTSPERRVRIRPVVPGRGGTWVRTGVSWRDLSYDSSYRPTRPAHQEALRELYGAYQSRRASHYGYGDQGAVHLDDFGPTLWLLLDQARDAGVAFVPAKGTAGPITLAAGRATVSLDLTRSAGTEEAPGLAAVPVVTVKGIPVPAADAEFVGRPIHGVVLAQEVVVPGTAGMLLAGLADTPSEPVCQLLTEGRGVEIPEVDVGRFLQAYLPRLRQTITVTCSDDAVQLPEIRPPRLAVTVTFLPQHEITLDWSFQYVVGDQTTRIAVDAPRDPAFVRDRAAEHELMAGLDLPDDRLPGLRPAPRGLMLLVPSARLTGLDAVFFTTDVLSRLRERDDVEVEVVGVAPAYRASESAPLVRISATEVRDDPDWFDLGVSVWVDDEELPFLSLFEALARDESHLILASGTYFSIERPEYDELRRLIDEARGLQDRESAGLRITAYQAGLWADLAKLGVVEAQSERWESTVQGLLEVDSLPRPEQPDGLVADLRPYQHEGFHWLSFLRDHGLGGILADDMGLGKTLQALALICQVIERDPLSLPFLVVAPTSVVPNWRAEAARFAPELDVVCVEETEARAGIGLAERVKGAHVVVTSYALFRIDYDAYAGVGWGGMLLDEAQYVKNYHSKTYQCVRRLDAPFKLAITGTPLENNLMDLWSMLSIVAPGLFPSPQRFTEHYRKPIERGTSPELLAQLRRRIRPLMLRRTKEQVAAELPPKQEQVFEVALQPRHQRIYQTHLQRERQKVLGMIGDLDKNRFAIFRSLTLLRQLALAPSLIDEKYANVHSSKVDAFMEQLDEVVREGHRALVFSQFTSFLRLVRNRLDGEGIASCYLDGRTRHRAAVIEDFKSGDAPVFLISLKAGGFGLNLTEADYCFVLDPWWNPAVEAQAVDRAHRIGQRKTVMVYRLVATDTIEEKVMELKARKQDLFSKVMDDDALLAAPLSVDDIKGLLGL